MSCHAPGTSSCTAMAHDSCENVVPTRAMQGWTPLKPRRRNASRADNGENTDGMALCAIHQEATTPGKSQNVTPAQIQTQRKHTGRFGSKPDAPSPHTLDELGLSALKWDAQPG